MHEQTGQTPKPAARSAPRPAHAEPLETRTLLAVQSPVTLSVGPNVNITRLLENQNEAAISIDRSDPSRLFAASVNDSRGTGPLDDVDLDNDGDPDPPPLLKQGVLRGLIGARSEDGGLTWTAGVLDSELLANGQSTNDAALPPACCDPSVAFDDFGNLFTTFINRNDTGSPDDVPEKFPDKVLVGMSTDLGRTFEIIGEFNGVVDQPTVVTGAGSVWVSFQLGGSMFASGARVLGPGVISSVAGEHFDVMQEAPRSDGGNFGDIAIGPSGEVMITYQVLRRDPDVFVPPGTSMDARRALAADIYVNFDPDGLGPEGFGRRFKATSTNVGTFDPIPAQLDRTIDAEAGLAWDRSGGPFNGRVWMVYTDETTENSDNDTDIFVRFSDDNGRTWSSRRIVNDEDFNRSSQFLPRIALDQTTGNIAVTWHDARIQNNLSFGPNDETSFWGTVGVPTLGEGGVAFAANIRISEGISDAHRSRAQIEYGDYTGLDFHNNVFYPVWADNSNSTGDNPSGGVNAGSNLATFDVYTARVTVTPATLPTPGEAPVGPGSPLTPDFMGRNTVTKGRAFKFRVRFESPNGVDPASLGGDDLLVTGPNGYQLFADFVKVKSARRGTIATGIYMAPAPGGKFDAGDNGLYRIQLQAGAVRDLANTVTAAGVLDQFLVSSKAPPQSPALLAAPVHAALAAATSGQDDDDDKLKAVGL